MEGDYLEAQTILKSGLGGERSDGQHLRRHLRRKGKKKMSFGRHRRHGRLELQKKKWANTDSKKCWLNNKF